MRLLRPPTFAPALALVLLASSFATASAAQAQRHQPPALPGPTERPYAAADYAWTIRGLDGRSVALSAFEGRVLFVHFWATYCGICVGELASLQRLWDSLRDRDDVAFVMVAKDSEAAEVAAFMQRRGYDFPVYLRAGRSEEFSARGIPSTYIVDRDGGVRAHVSGAADWGHGSANAYLLALARGEGERR